MPKVPESNAFAVMLAEEGWKRSRIRKSRKLRDTWKCTVMIDSGVTVNYHIRPYGDVWDVASKEPRWWEKKEVRLHVDSPSFDALIAELILEGDGNLLVGITARRMSKKGNGLTVDHIRELSKVLRHGSVPVVSSAHGRLVGEAIHEKWERVHRQLPKTDFSEIEKRAAAYMLDRKRRADDDSKT